MSNRRQLLKLGAMAGVAAVLPGGVLAAHPANANRALPTAGNDTATDSLWPSRQELAARLNATFLVQRDGEPSVPIVLVDVADPATTRVNGGTDPLRFRATFRGSSRAPLTQKTYDVAAKGLGEFEMFLVPVGLTRGTYRYYEAAFNRAQPE